MSCFIDIRYDRGNLYEFQRPSIVGSWPEIYVRGVVNCSSLNMFYKDSSKILGYAEVIPDQSYIKCYMDGTDNIYYYTSSPKNIAFYANTKTSNLATLKDPNWVNYRLVDCGYHGLTPLPKDSSSLTTLVSFY